MRSVTDRFELIGAVGVSNVSTRKAPSLRATKTVRGCCVVAGDNDAVAWVRSQFSGMASGANAASETMGPRVDNNDEGEE
jgi:hypothetical protein